MKLSNRQKMYQEFFKEARKRQDYTASFQRYSYYRTTKTHYIKPSKSLKRLMKYYNIKGGEDTIGSYENHQYTQNTKFDDYGTYEVQIANLPVTIGISGISITVDIDVGVKDSFWMKFGINESSKYATITMNPSEMYYKHQDKEQEEFLETYLHQGMTEEQIFQASLIVPEIEVYLKVQKVLKQLQGLLSLLEFISPCYWTVLRLIHAAVEDSK